MAELGGSGPSLGSGDDQHWYTWLAALLGALRARGNGENDPARIPEPVQKIAPGPLGALDQHNAALDAALHASD